MSGPIVLTPSQTCGPLFGFGLLFEGSECTVAPDDPAAIQVEGVILDGAGEPLAYPDGLVEIWAGSQFARTRTDERGMYRFLVARPDAVPMADGRTQAPHFNLAVFAPGLLKQLQTRLYLPDEPANADDPVLALAPAARRRTLIARAEEGRLRFDVRMQGDGETLFFDF